MQTILDYTQEIVDEIRRYEDEFTLTFTPDTIPNYQLLRRRRLDSC